MDGTVNQVSLSNIQPSFTEQAPSQAKGVISKIILIDQMVAKAATGGWVRREMRAPVRKG